MGILWCGKILEGSALTAMTSAFMLAAGGVAEAGPCTADINELQTRIRLSVSNPVVGPTAPQTVGAQLHHQPTPGNVENAETKANAEADAALDRARKADARGDAAGCQAALRQARELYGLTQD